MRTATQLFRLDEFLTWILAFFVFALFLDKVVLEHSSAGSSPGGGW